MPQWIARVELRDNATGADYERLHQAMNLHGFRRYIITASKVFHLPSATYWKDDTSRIPRASIWDSVSSAAKRSGKPFWIFVTQFSDADTVLYLPSNEHNRLVDLGTADLEFP